MPNEECYRAQGEQAATIAFLKQALAELRADMRERDDRQQEANEKLHAENRDLCKQGHDRITRLEHRMAVLEAKIAAYVVAGSGIFLVIKEILLPLFLANK